VSKALREGIRDSIEILANEVIDQAAQKGQSRLQHRNGHRRQRADQPVPALPLPAVGVALRRVPPRAGHRARQRRDLHRGLQPRPAARAVPGGPRHRARPRNGTHLNESLTGLFELVNKGYHAESAEQQLFVSERSPRRRQRPALQRVLPPVPRVGCPALRHPLHPLPRRGEAAQRGASAGAGQADVGYRQEEEATRLGYISYAQLGINQLGAVYEGLMAYTGFFATGDLFEVAKGGDPSGGTWMLPVTDADEYPDDVFVMAENPTTGRNERVRHNKGSFVFRLSGRDRQRSASYYTPEVLTRCVVHHALAELLGLDDYAPEGGSANIQDATELLDLTICEPALGSGAFLNEAINQLSAEYLKRRQAELGETLDPDAYLRELQKVKAHFALHQSYGVDLNATAVELAEVSLWLNAMHPGLKAPWLGLQLRRGNSLIGARRATWKVGQLKHRPWAETRKATCSHPPDRKLTEPAGNDSHCRGPSLPAARPRLGCGCRPQGGQRAEGRRGQAPQNVAHHHPQGTQPSTPQASGSAGRREWRPLWEQGNRTTSASPQQGLRRPIDVYGATIADRRARHQPEPKPCRPSQTPTHHWVDCGR
jgi:hypothetical protein